MSEAGDLVFRYAWWGLTAGLAFWIGRLPRRRPGREGAQSPGLRPVREGDRVVGYDLVCPRCGTALRPVAGSAASPDFRAVHRCPSGACLYATQVPRNYAGFGIEDALEGRRPRW